MKRKHLIKLLESKGAKFIRSGGNHDIYELNNKRFPIKRHNEIDEVSVKKLFKQLGLKL